MAIRDIAATLDLLTPWDIPGRAKLRVGAGTGDGAYILLDMLRPAQRVLSFGVGRNVSFDLDMAMRGHTVMLYDHTVEGPPVAHERFRFHALGITGTSDPAARLLSLADHVAAIEDAGDDMILKIDVEGAEWPALAAAPAGLLARFEQVVLEIHGLFSLGGPDKRRQIATGLARLRETHTLFHVHANNQAPPKMVGGFPVSNLLELSWVRTDLVDRVPSGTLYPTELDQPNVARSPDTLLWFHPFMPVRIPAARLKAMMAATLRRIAAQEAAAARFLAHQEARLAKQSEARKTTPTATQETTP